MRTREQNRHYMGDYRARKHDEVNAWRRANYAQNPDPIQRSNRCNALRRKYNISCEEYDNLACEQGGVCAICQQPETRVRGGKVQPLVVDHDHETGKVRGLLCHACNSGIGYLRDDPVRFKAASDYVLKNIE